MENKKLYGLVGKNISYSFSITYFSEKFSLSPFLDNKYQNFDIKTINSFKTILKKNPALQGLNVTIPYKEKIIPFLDEISEKALKIGAVNVIRFKKNGKLKGYNSDWFGFKKSLQTVLLPQHKKALILGTGGAAKAVSFALTDLNIPHAFVSREVKENSIDYSLLNATTFDNYQIIINCTPLGTFPNINYFPPIPYQFFSSNHIAFDLVYNPQETQFLKKAKKKGALTKNGYEMLVFQAEKSWKIWHK